MFILCVCICNCTHTDTHTYMHRCQVSSGKWSMALWETHSCLPSSWIWPSLMCLQPFTTSIWNSRFQMEATCPLLYLIWDDLPEEVASNMFARSFVGKKCVQQKQKGGSPGRGQSLGLACPGFSSFCLGWLNSKVSLLRKNIHQCSPLEPLCT